MYMSRGIRLALVRRRIISTLNLYSCELCIALVQDIRMQSWCIFEQELNWSYVIVLVAWCTSPGEFSEAGGCRCNSICDESVSVLFERRHVMTRKLGMRRIRVSGPNGPHLA